MKKIEIKKKFKNYFSWNIPMRSIWSVIGIIVLTPFAYFQAKYYLIPEFREYFYLLKDSFPEFMKFLWVPIISYLFISVWICLFLNIFKKIKKYKNGGIINWMVVGLYSGALSGLVAGLILWQIGVVAAGLIDFLNLGLIGGLTIGIIFGLILGLIYEFKNKETTANPKNLEK